ncbi:hypothetical protein EA462_09940 [Natrarchaeobius halalkaliphilus]|uniref:Uncharacterized protein n=1 Tax=Natrarchaeobius halalkaliphilus TaxID=1679091 RepID=A0A3N6NZC8_9EURY|nr:hypothetical protein [Natrarchaeobius halalkaliphilus]RQG90289.1 hypothetical protein EA462_09940 [Natrarchaeobius halalkaliphilus]
MIGSRPTRARWSDRRGITEVLSFVLVFAIVFLSVLLVGVGGFGAISEYQEHERLASAQLAIETFAENGNDLARSDGVTDRTGALGLQTGTVSPGERGTTLNVTVFDDDGDAWNWSEDYPDEDLGAFAYRTGSEAIVYEGGGVFRTGGDGSSAVVSDPMITCRENVAVITLVKLTHDDRTIQSDQRLTFALEQDRANTTRAYYDEAENVTIEIEGGPSSGGWEMFFENEERWTFDEDDERWACASDRVSIDVVEIGIDYSELE